MYHLYSTVFILYLLIQSIISQSCGSDSYYIDENYIGGDGEAQLFLDGISCQCPSGFYNVFLSEGRGPFRVYLQINPGQIRARFGRSGVWNFERSPFATAQETFLTFNDLNFLASLANSPVSVETDIEFTLNKGYGNSNPSTLHVRYLNDLSIPSTLCLGGRSTSFRANPFRPSGRPSGLTLMFDGRSKVTCTQRFQTPNGGCGRCGTPTLGRSSPDFALERISFVGNNEGGYFTLFGSYYYLYVTLKACDSYRPPPPINPEGGVGGGFGTGFGRPPTRPNPNGAILPGGTFGPQQPPPSGPYRPPYIGGRPGGFPGQGPRPEFVRPPGGNNGYGGTGSTGNNERPPIGPSDDDYTGSNVRPPGDGGSPNDNGYGGADRPGDSGGGQIGGSNPNQGYRPGNNDNFNINGPQPGQGGTMTGGGFGQGPTTGGDQTNDGYQPGNLGFGPNGRPGAIPGTNGNIGGGGFGVGQGGFRPNRGSGGSPGGFGGNMGGVGGGMDVGLGGPQPGSTGFDPNRGQGSVTNPNGSGGFQGGFRPNRRPGGGQGDGTQTNGFGGGQGSFRPGPNTGVGNSGAGGQSGGFGGDQGGMGPHRGIGVTPDEINIGNENSQGNTHPGGGLGGSQTGSTGYDPSLGIGGASSGGFGGEQGGNQGNGQDLGEGQNGGGMGEGMEQGGGQGSQTSDQAVGNNMRPTGGLNGGQTTHQGGMIGGNGPTENSGSNSGMSQTGGGQQQSSRSGCGQPKLQDPFRRKRDVRQYDPYYTVNRGYRPDRNRDYNKFTNMRGRVLPRPVYPPTRPPNVPALPYRTTNRLGSSGRIGAVNVTYTTLPNIPGPFITTTASIQSGRIINGVRAKRGSWPWQVSIRYKGIHSCGGSLISDRYVVTASHCQFGRRSPGDITLSFGTLFSGGVSDEFEQTRTAARIIENENFNQGLRFNNDVAIIELQTPVQFSDYVSPICLPSNPPAVGAVCYVTGYGTTKGTGVENVLHEVAIPIITSQQCSDPNWLGDKINSNMFCAGGGDKDSCQGDSGGPLQCLDEGAGNLWILTGIVSWGIDCGKATKPGVYTNVYNYLEWIKKNAPI